MLKISLSSSGESSTMTRISVCGLKYVPGRLTSSSSSYLRPSAISAAAYRAIAMTKPPVALQIEDLPLDLGVDVERRLARTRAAVIACDHQLPDLVPQLGVHVRCSGQARQFCVHVDRSLAAALASGVAGLEHLADLVVTLADAAAGAAARAGLAV